MRHYWTLAIRSCTLHNVRDPRLVIVEQSDMSLTKRGVPKAKLIKELYRDPKYKGGKCCVCRKRSRNCLHPVYPHMCGECLRTRVAIDDMPIAAREVMSQQARIDAEMLERYLASKQPKGVQSLNEPTAIARPSAPTLEKIQANAARFREHIAANPITDDMRRKINESAARFRNTLKK